jgi:hypothetical protein
MRYWLFAFLFLAACTTTSPSFRLENYTSSECRPLYEGAEKKTADHQLDLVSELFNKGCFSEVISLGNYLRNYRRDKFYQITNETAELLTPEGTFTEYVMESHERGVLTILMAISFLHMNREEAALVELRQTANEQKVELYNFGRDPMITLMLATLWDRWSPSLSRPFWQSLGETKLLDPMISKFARERVQEIDLFPSEKRNWKIQGYGTLPDVKWESQFFSTKSGPYKIIPMAPFFPNCADKNTLILNTRPWLEKLNLKYQSDYHPFLYAKSLARLPFGLTYGILGVSTGAAVGVGGCMIAGRLESRDFCNYSLKSAVSIMGSSVDLVGYTLKPDLRRWRKLPSVIVFDRNGAKVEPSGCLQDVGALQLTLDLTAEENHSAY